MWKRSGARRLAPANVKYALSPDLEHHLLFDRLVDRLAAPVRRAPQALRRHLLALTTPAPTTLAVATLTDMMRSKPALILEHALLRQQVVILQRGVTRPRCTSIDRGLLVLLARRLRPWRQALLIVQPATVLRWHRQLFRLWGQRKTHATTPAHRPALASETVALMRAMAAANRTWGAERIRGALLKLHIRVAKSTIQTSLRDACPPPRTGQTWATFLRNHGHAIWATDVLPLTNLLVRPLYAFVLIDLASRRVVPVGVTRHPTDAWVAQQLREATPFAQRPRFLIRDNDSKYGPAFSRVATASGSEEWRTAYRAPKENAICERFLGSVRRACLDHLLVLSEPHLVLSEPHLRRILQASVRYFNDDRPPQGLQQRMPTASDGMASTLADTGLVQAVPVLGSLHHSYRRAA